MKIVYLLATIFFYYLITISRGMGGANDRTLIGLWGTGIVAGIILQWKKRHDLIIADFSWGLLWGNVVSAILGFIFLIG